MPNVVLGPAPTNQGSNPSSLLLAPPDADGTGRRELCNQSKAPLSSLLECPGRRGYPRLVRVRWTLER